MSTPVIIPESFRTAPRWRGDFAGQAWVDQLPETTSTWLRRWNLRLDGVAVHGANAVVLPVIDDLHGPSVLRLTAPDATSAATLKALVFWQPNEAMVRLFRCTANGEALLMERLDATRPLHRESPTVQATVLIGLARELAVGPPPVGVSSTMGVAHHFVDTARTRWHDLGEPFPEEWLTHAEHVAAGLCVVRQPLPTNGDLHPDQALRRSDGRWVMLDPVLLRGDPSFDAARILWDVGSRLTSVSAIQALAQHLSHTLGKSAEQPLSWMLVRTLDYWMWCRRVGITSDPFGCERIAAALIDVVDR